MREECAGLEASCLGWLHERRVSVLGSDGHSDLRPSPYKLSMAPIHLGAIVMMGVHLIDNADLEELAEACKRIGRYHFMFMMAPLVLERGTASPVNPIVIF
jgi:kynurenine formamidase